jgi:hypothetical protein
MYKLSSFRSYQLVYVDESGCDKRIGFRRTGWSPLGTTPVQIAQYQREQRYQILPAYTQDGMLLSRVFGERLIALSSRILLNSYFTTASHIQTQGLY